MKLVLRADTPPPPKQSWHDPSAIARGEWSSHYEVITNWFCTSHDFNHDNDLLITLHDMIIELRGSEIRYLAPSLRSAASLLHKAYVRGTSLAPGTHGESTPGIFVYRGPSQIDLPRPHYQLVCRTDSSEAITASGTVFTYPTPGASLYRAPASRLSQAIVWLLQERIE